MNSFAAPNSSLSDPWIRAAGVNTYVIAMDLFAGSRRARVPGWASTRPDLSLLAPGTGYVATMHPSTSTSEADLSRCQKGVLFLFLSILCFGLRKVHPRYRDSKSLCLEEERALLPSGYTGGQQRQKNHLERGSLLGLLASRRKEKQPLSRGNRTTTMKGILLILI